MRINTQTKFSQTPAIVDLGNAVVRTRGLDPVGSPDSVQGQRFRMTGLTAD